MEARGVSEEEKEEEMGVPPSFPPPTAAYPEKEGRKGGGVTFRSSSLFLSTFFWGGGTFCLFFVGWEREGSRLLPLPLAARSFASAVCQRTRMDGGGYGMERGGRGGWGRGRRRAHTKSLQSGGGGGGGPLLLPFLPLGPSFPFLARGSIRGSGEKGSSSGYWYTTVWACREEAPFLERGDASVVRALGSPEGERGCYAGMRKNRPKQTRASPSSSSLFCVRVPRGDNEGKGVRAE